MFEWLVASIPGLPLLAALWIGINALLGRHTGESGERPTARIALFAVSASVLVLCVVDVAALLQGRWPGPVHLANWISSGDIAIHLSFQLDALGLGMAHLVAFIALLTTRFSVNYLHREAGFQRFFMVLSLFTGAMLLIVMSGNAALTFAGWELAGVASYLLIAYAYDRPVATENATRAFITNRIGDAGFIVALVCSLLWIGDLEWTTLLGNVGGLDTLSAGIIAGGFLIAALAKSAQLPFAAWISRALEGPTPSSAIFYGSLMVHAGVFLIIRLEPLFSQDPALLHALLVFGILTAVYGFFAGLVQTDVKTALMFSTTTQVGLMFAACGLGWFNLAAGYLAAHAIWRAYQFLSAPALMHLMSRPNRPVPAWLARRRWLYTASLQRFWLDPIANWLLVNPTRAAARDIETFEERVVIPLVGLPGYAGAVSSLAQWEEATREGVSGRVIGDTGAIGSGTGAAGKLMEWVASLLHWFEEHLVLRSGGQGIAQGIERIGRNALKIETLLCQPRYLLLLILATFVVIV